MFLTKINYHGKILHCSRTGQVHGESKSDEHKFYWKSYLKFYTTPSDNSLYLLQENKL